MGWQFLPKSREKKRKNKKHKAEQQLQVQEEPFPKYEISLDIQPESRRKNLSSKSKKPKMPKKSGTVGHEEKKKSTKEKEVSFQEEDSFNLVSQNGAVIEQINSSLEEKGKIPKKEKSLRNLKKSDKSSSNYESNFGSRAKLSHKSKSDLPAEREEKKKSLKEKDDGFNLVSQNGTVIEEISKTWKEQKLEDEEKFPKTGKRKEKSSRNLKKSKKSGSSKKSKFGSAASLSYKSKTTLPSGQQEGKKKKKKTNVPTSDHALIHFIKWFNSGLRGAQREDYKMPVFPAREEEFLHLLDDGFVITMILSMINHAGVSSEQELKIIDNSTHVREADENKRHNVDFVIEVCRNRLKIEEKYIFTPEDLLGYTREDLKKELKDKKKEDKLDSDPLERNKFLRGLKKEGNISKVCITLRYIAKSAAYNPDKEFYLSIPEQLRREIDHIPEFGGFGEHESQEEAQVPHKEEGEPHGEEDHVHKNGYHDIIVNKINEVAGDIQQKAMTEISKITAFVPKPAVQGEHVGKYFTNGMLLVGAAAALRML
mmetsp:Transcript_9007/g.11298  ORF Transcript_9007/g.11298 Transcript_9007/m.11298 type:complete len:539 (-) Transcript_9007:107-1723(-)